MSWQADYEPFQTKNGIGVREMERRGLGGGVYAAVISIARATLLPYRAE
jgi:hypothetical protein